MAGRANSLTTRASGSVTVRPSTWTMPASEVRVVLTALGELGHHVSALIDAAGLTGTNFDDPDVRVSCEAYGTLIACAQQRRFTPNLAFELARRTPLGAYPLLDYLVITSDTVGAGIRQLARYFRIETIPIVFDIRDDRDPVEVSVSAPAPFGVEYLLSLMTLHMRHETEGRFVFLEVLFQHQPDDVAALSDALGCPASTMSSWDGVRMSRECWTLPLRRRDPILRRVLETQANDILTRLPSRMGIALEVQRTLAARVAGGDTRIVTVARHLAMSARSLQRRLSAEGVTYEALVEETRKEAARRYVAGSTLSLAEIAYLVGYSEPASFHRAFKRWYGVTPEGFRRREAPDEHREAAYAHRSPA
jgi:AraC-like DNA-binding protein